MKNELQSSKEKTIRNTLGIFLLFLALNAFGGGWYGMAGAKEVPEAWLQGSPFTSYFLPGLLLFICVGGSALYAGISVLRRTSQATKSAYVCSIILQVWIAAQLAIIGFVSWLQPAIFLSALVVLFLTYSLRRYEQ